MLEFLYNKKNINSVTQISETKSFVLNYPKFFIRGFNDSEPVLDNSFEISVSIKNTRTNPSGYSVILDKTLYAHKLYRNLKFCWFNPEVHFKQRLNKNLISENLKHYILFIKITKGGVDCYSSGFRGMLPREQLLIAGNQQRTNIAPSKLNLFINLKKNSKFIFFRAPVGLAKITAYSGYKSSLATNRTQNISNIIFNYSNKPNKNEIQKTNKKNHKSNYRKKN
jgi:hypothetical protein